MSIERILWTSLLPWNSGDPALSSSWAYRGLAAGSVIMIMSRKVMIKVSMIITFINTFIPISRLKYLAVRGKMQQT